MEEPPPPPPPPPALLATEPTDEELEEEVSALASTALQTPAGGVARLLQQTLSSLSHNARVPAVPSKICGRVFVDGDLAYSCKTCQADATCVQCADCFKDSHHEGHNVFFHRAGAGGSCDCGDVAAWDVAGCCSRHGPNANAAEDPSQLLPSALRRAARVVFAACVRVLATVTHRSVKSFHATAMIKQNDHSFYNDLGEYHVIINNDDVHTFEEVISALQELVIRNREEDASIPVLVPQQLTNAVHNVGRTSVHRAKSFRDAQRVVTFLLSKGLLVSLAPVSLLEAEKLAVAIVVWLQSVCDKSPALARVFIVELLREDPMPGSRRLMVEWLQQVLHPGHEAVVRALPFPLVPWDRGSFLDTIVRIHGVLPKLFVAQIQDLFMRMVKDEFFRTELGCSLAENLPDIAHWYALGLGTEEESLLDIMVQVFTVKQVSAEFQRRFAHRNSNASVVLQCVDALERFLMLTRVPNSADGTIDTTNRAILQLRFRVLSRGFPYAFGMGRVAPLVSPPPLLVPDHQHQQPQILALRRLLGVLKPIHFLDRRMRRQALDHVPFENPNSFAIPFDVLLRFMQEIVNPATTALFVDTKAAGDARVVDLVLRTCAEVCIELTDRLLLPPASAGVQQKTIANGQVPVSIHLPVHRFCALYARKVAGMFPNDLSPARLNECLAGSPERFVQLPLNALVLRAQVNIGLWVRDGMVLQHAISLYGSGKLRKEFLDLDLFALQMACAALEDGVVTSGESRFLPHFLKSFSVYTWLCKGSTAVAESEVLGFPNDQDRAKRLQRMCEEAMQILVYMVSSLPMVRTAESARVEARRAIVHCLACADSSGVPYSTIISALERERIMEDEEHSLDSLLLSADVDAIVGSVARRMTNSQGESRYELLAECWLTDVNPFYWHSSIPEQESAMEKRDKHVAASKRPVAFVPANYSTGAPVASEFTAAQRMFSGVLMIQGVIGSLLCDAVEGNSQLFAGTGVRTLQGGPPVKWSEEELKYRSGRTSA